MCDEEYERFEITDYDLDNEFNPNRPRRKLTKNQQIYGIWADDSDNDDADRSSRKGRSGFSSLPKSNKNKNYTAPVSFVAGGIQQSNKEKNRETRNIKEESNSITDEEDDDNVEKTDIHTGFRGGNQTTILDVDMSNSSNSEEDEVTVKHYNNKQKYSIKHTPKKIGDDKLKMGAWEQHTRGIGAKLLLQMGYEPGKGLGKDLQGIAQPVQAHVRKGRGAIGAYGPEMATSKPSASVYKSETGADVKEPKENLSKWRKTSVSNNGSGENRTEKFNKKYNYKSVEEVLEKGKKNPFSYTSRISKNLSNVPVIDMTGPEKRVLSGYHALSQSKIQDDDYCDTIPEGQPKKTSVCFALPELMHNLSLIVYMCEQDIISLDTSQHSASARQAVLEKEKKQLEDIVKLEENHMNTLNKTLQLVDELVSNNDNLNLQRAEDIFLTLQNNFATEYKEFSLNDLAASIVAPLLREHLSQWQPLDNPTMHVDLIKKWRNILERYEVAENKTQSNIFDPYSALIWAGVIPSFRACAEHWNPKNHHLMAALLDCWASLFSSWILDSVLEQLILPRLIAGVRSWDPLTDTVPIHIWILPWNSLIGEKMEKFIYPIIREKLGCALQAWMPQDRSARAMLSPWKGAFDTKEMEIFLLQHIIPKLQLVLNDFIICPLQQDLELWNQVWEWHELLSTAQMARLLDKYFFPKWMQVLVVWLNQMPDFIDISHWYTGWKSMLSDELLQDTHIKEHLRRALEMMQRATDSITSTPASTLPPVVGSTTTTPLPQPPLISIPPPLMDLHLMPPTPMEFKDLVSLKCSERGILFVPLAGRRETGKQIYRIGKLYCYIDRNVCMMSDGTFNKWTPTSLQSLLDCAMSGVF